MRRASTGLAVAWALVSACGCSESAPPSLREQIQRHIATALVVPSFEAFNHACAALDRDVAALAATPSQAALATAQATWRDARLRWATLQPHFLGPPLDRLADAQVSSFPIAEAALEALLASAEVIDAALVARLGGNRKGMLVIEWLLFGPTRDAAGDAAALSALSQPRRRLLLRALAADLAGTARRMYEDWAPGARNHLARHLSRSRATLETELLDRLLIVVNRLKDDRVGVPLGLKVSQPVAAPERSEADRSGHAKTEVVQTLRTVERVFLGLGGPGLRAALDEAAPRVFPRVEATMNASFGTLASLPGTIASTSRGDGYQVFYELRAVRSIIEVEVAGALQTVITFASFDGD